jgi:hypothetical protein
MPVAKALESCPLERTILARTIANRVLDQPSGISDHRSASRTIEAKSPVTEKQSALIDPYEFILDNIDSVPQLESLILFWNSRPVGWTCDEMASRLYVPADKVSEIIRDLVRMQLIQEIPGLPARFSYLPRSVEQDSLMYRVDESYRRDLVRISTMVHSKASSPVREFARAFRLRKDRDS